MAEQYDKNNKRRDRAKILLIGVLAAYSFQPQLKAFVDAVQHPAVSSEGQAAPLPTEPATRAKKLGSIVELCRGYAAVTLDPRGSAVITIDPVRASSNEIIIFDGPAYNRPLPVSSWYSLELNRPVAEDEVNCRAAQLIDARENIAVSDNTVQPACDTSTTRPDLLSWRRWGGMSEMQHMLEEAVGPQLNLLAEQEAFNACKK